MGKHSLFLAGLFAILIVSSGCQKSSDNSPGSPTPQQNPDTSGGENGNSQPGNPANPGNGSQGLVATNLVKKIQFVSGAETLVTQNEAADFESEYSECGVSDSLVPVCKGSAFLVSNYTISTYGPSASSISGKVSRYKPTGKTLYLFRVDGWTADGKKTSILDAFVSADTTTNLDTLAQQAAQKLSAIPADERISKLEETLGVKHLAGIIEFAFANEGEFASAYASQTTPRAFYHWSAIALSKGYKSAPLVQFFRDHFSEKLAASSLTYKELFVEQGMTAADFWKVTPEILTAFKTEYAASSEISLRGKLAISILILVPAKDASADYLSEGKSYLLSTSESVWIRRGVSLFTKYGSTFGSSSELVKFGSNSDYSVRREVASALANYADELANQWVLRLTADSYSYVRDAALVTIQGRNYDFGNFDVSSLINANDYSSRVGLAKGLHHAKGLGVNIALLRLNADSYSYVRDAALNSINGRDLDLANFDVSSLINVNDYSSRVGLAKALKFAKKQNASEALLRLNADSYSYVRDAALVSIEGRNWEPGSFEVSALINPNDYSSRVGLAKALKHVAGQKANEALLHLCADSYSYVRDAALSSIGGRNYDFGNFNVSALINPNDYSSRVGLAKALQSARGAKADAALIQLNADSYSYVRDAALISIAARPFDAGSISVSSYINPNDYSSRVGLAKALKYVTGKASVDTLITLLSDSYSYVRDAAKESLKALTVTGTDLRPPAH